MSKRKPIRTDIAWSTTDRITVKGYDLCKDVLGTLSLGDMAFLELTDRLPTTREIKTRAEEEATAHLRKA